MIAQGACPALEGRPRAEDVIPFQPSQLGCYGGGGSGYLTEFTEIQVYSGEVNTVLQRIRSENNTTIWLVGGTGITEQFLQESLIEEFILFIIPIILGEGIPLFPDGIPEKSLKLISAETLDDRIVKLVYRKR